MKIETIKKFAIISLLVSTLTFSVCLVAGDEKPIATLPNEEPNDVSDMASSTVLFATPGARAVPDGVEKDFTDELGDIPGYEKPDLVTASEAPDHDFEMVETTSTSSDQNNLPSAQSADQTPNSLLNPLLVEPLTTSSSDNKNKQPDISVGTSMATSHMMDSQFNGLDSSETTDEGSFQKQEDMMHSFARLSDAPKGLNTNNIQSHLDNRDEIEKFTSDVNPNNSILEEIVNGTSSMELAAQQSFVKQCLREDFECHNTMLLYEAAAQAEINLQPVTPKSKKIRKAVDKMIGDQLDISAPAPNPHSDDAAKVEIEKFVKNAITQGVNAAILNTSLSTASSSSTNTNNSNHDILSKQPNTFTFSFKNYPKEWLKEKGIFVKEPTDAILLEKRENLEGSKSTDKKEPREIYQATDTQDKIFNFAINNEYCWFKIQTNSKSSWFPIDNINVKILPCEKEHLEQINLNRKRLNKELIQEKDIQSREDIKKENIKEFLDKLESDHNINPDRISPIRTTLAQQQKSKSWSLSCLYTRNECIIVVDKFRGLGDDRINFILPFDNNNSPTTSSSSTSTKFHSETERRCLPKIVMPKKELTQLLKLHNLSAPENLPDDSEFFQTHSLPEVTSSEENIPERPTTTTALKVTDWRPYIAGGTVLTGITLLAYQRGYLKPATDLITHMYDKGCATAAAQSANSFIQTTWQTILNSKYIPEVPTTTRSLFTNWFNTGTRIGSKAVHDTITPWALIGAGTVGAALVHEEKYPGSSPIIKGIRNTAKFGIPTALIGITAHRMGAGDKLSKIGVFETFQRQSKFSTRYPAISGSLGK